MPSSPIDDERYLAFLRAMLDSAKDVAGRFDYATNGVVILVEVDGQGVTIASSLDDDQEIRKVLAEALARSHNVTSRRVE